MNDSFDTAKRLIENMFHLQISPLENHKHIQDFCAANILHPVQHLFHADNLKHFLTNLEPNTIYHINDQLQIHYILLLRHSKPMIIGPFCTRIFSTNDCIQLLRHLNLSINLYTSLLAYRDKFPVLGEHVIINIVKSFLDVVENKTSHWKILNQEFIPASDIAIELKEHILKKDYSEFIREHYTIEKRFMEQIIAGDTSEALFYLRKQQREFQSFKKLGTTLENERIAAAIVRTMVRIAAMEAGLPALTIDLLSRNNTIATQRAKNIDEIYLAKEKMVAEFCNAICLHTNQQYSNIIIDIIYYMEHQYDEDISIKTLANEFKLSPNHLTTLFHQQTGDTPLAYLRKIRTRQAAHLLSTTQLSIQEVSTRVGIADANYFIKLFKKDYHETPTAYRQHNKL